MHDVEPVPTSMRAIAIDAFGGIEKLQLRTLDVPQIDADEVLIRLRYAGVGEWDPFEREGGYAEMMGRPGKFPYVLGSEGSGTVAAVGKNVTKLRPGDRVYAAGFLNPKGGFYAEYAAVRAEVVSPVPGDLTDQQAGVVSGCGVTALRGLEDTLKLKRGESILIAGANGAIGHLAVQLAKRMGARVQAVASHADGVALALRLGADAAIDGRQAEVLAAARTFAPQGLDAALLTASSDAILGALEAMREGGRVAFPTGVRPEPKASRGVRVEQYNGEPDAEIIARLNRYIDADGGFEVHVGGVFPLEEANAAQRALREHHLGKYVLRIH